MSADFFGTRKCEDAGRIEMRRGDDAHARTSTGMEDPAAVIGCRVGGETRVAGTLDAAVIAGMKRERMVVDPGFGFGKNREENYPLAQTAGRIS